MTRYAAFLRGVNVGGVTLKMADVARAFEDAGFSNVATVLASGNVLLDSPAAVNSVRSRAEKALRDAFGYDAWVLAYDVDTVRAISENYPFEREVEGHHSYVTFVTDPDVLDELAGLSAGPDEKIWRLLMTPIRAVAIRLTEAGEASIHRKGRSVDPRDFKGVYRIGRPAG